MRDLKEKQLCSMQKEVEYTLGHPAKVFPSHGIVLPYCTRSCKRRGCNTRERQRARGRNKEGKDDGTTRVNRHLGSPERLETPGGFGQKGGKISHSVPRGELAPLIAPLAFWMADQKNSVIFNLTAGD